MPGLPQKFGAITLFVGDPQASKEFYGRVFDASPIFEADDAVTLKIGDVLLNLLADSSAGELIEPAAVGTRDAGARAQFTVWVDDAEAAFNELKSRNIEFLNGPIDRPWGVRTAAFSDPDGHMWELAQQVAG
jgi:lactoylglutathione lyase